MEVLRFHAAATPVPPRPITGRWWVQVRRSDDARPGIGLRGTRTRRMPRERRACAAVDRHRHLRWRPWAPAVVLPVAADVHGRGLTAERCDGAFVSHPVDGKHLAFDGRLLHGALHDLAAPPPHHPARRRADTPCAARQRVGRPHARQAARVPESLAAHLSNRRATAFAPLADEAVAAAVLTAGGDGAGRRRQGARVRRDSAAVIAPPRAAASRPGARARGWHTGARAAARAAAVGRRDALAAACAVGARRPSVASQRMEAAAAELRGGGESRRRRCSGCCRLQSGRCSGRR